MLDESLQGFGGHLYWWRLAQQPRKLFQGQVAAQAGLSVPTVRLLEQDNGLVRSFLRVLHTFDLMIAGHSLPPGDQIGQSVALLRKRRGI